MHLAPKYTCSEMTRVITSESKQIYFENQEEWEWTIPPKEAARNLFIVIHRTSNFAVCKCMKQNFTKSPLSGGGGGGGGVGADPSKRSFFDNF